MKDVLFTLAAATSLLAACDHTEPVDFDRDGTEVPEDLPDSATSSLVSEARGLPSAAGFDLRITGSGADITLEWDDVGGPYEIWRSTTPYFVPGDAGSTLLAGAPMGTQYTDVGGNDDNNDTSYYYRVAAPSNHSQIVGKYVQSCETGYNKISQPLVFQELNDAPNDAPNDRRTARYFFELFESPPSSVHLFDADTQSYDTWMSNYDPKWGMFSYGPGQCPIVRYSGNMDDVVHKTFGIVPAVSDMQRPLVPGHDHHNYVTLPLHLGTMMASELLAIMPAGSTVAGFTPTGPTDPPHGDGGGDFEIRAGSCISVSVTNSFDWPPDPLRALDDEFDDPSLPGWTQHNEDDATVTVEDGQCTIEPEPNTVWYQNSETNHLSKPVSGNFAVTVDLSVTNVAGGSIVPGALYRIAGLMIRAPQNPTPDTYHVGLGVLDNPNELIFEYKTTNDGTSTYGSAPYGQNEAELRICRLDGEVHGLFRTPGGDWTLVNTESRADLPDTVLAGPMAYAYPNVSDLRCTVDWIHFKTVTSLGDCMTD